MDIAEKLRILSDAAKYDVACTSSGVDRKAKSTGIGSAAAAGICHSFSADGRCISLLKILHTNYCIYNCAYCYNRNSNDIKRAAFTPTEIAELTMNFYRRNYIEGLFLSSAVIKSPDYTMELLYKAIHLLRNTYKFNGYIHVKAIPGADKRLIASTGLMADRMSVNIELPSEDSLRVLAPEKSKDSILKPMKLLKEGIVRSKEEVAIYKHAPVFVPAGQSTQLIVGATDENDKKIIDLAEGLYKSYSLKRVFYSAYNPVTESKFLPDSKPPLLREHRLYQADWLLRFYGFKSADILKTGNLSLDLDPKCSWAVDNLDRFPVEIQTADYYTLLKVPGIGVTAARRICMARKMGRLDFFDLKKMGVVLKRAKFFITCYGKTQELCLNRDVLLQRLNERKFDENFSQMTLSENDFREAAYDANRIV